MSTEIERKFLIKNDSWREGAVGVHYKQGYLCRNENGIVRVRVAGEQGFLTIKGKSTGISRSEFEYEIPLADAESMLKMCTTGVIEKQRFKIPFGSHIWEVDEFYGDNAGLIFAEIELKSENELFEIPDWIGDEVTGDSKYYNASLVSYPFKMWPQK